MKASLKGRYELERSSATATFTVLAGDARIKASMTDATFAKGSSLNGLALSLEKPGSFIIDYNVPNQDFRFQFMNTVLLLEKPVGLTYTHVLGAHQTALDGSLALDPANKLSVNYSFVSGNCKVKYVYAHGELRRTVLEPTYDVSKNTWDFAVTRKFEAGDSLKATYQTSSKVLGLEWNRDSKINGCFKECRWVLKIWGIVLPNPISLQQIFAWLKTETAHHAPSTVATIFCFLCYQVWRNRLAKTHGRPYATPAVVAATVLSNLSCGQILALRFWDTAGAPCSIKPSSWCPPPHGWLKANFDGALACNGIGGRAAIIRLL